MVVAVVALAPEGLNLWLGHEYMVHSTAVMRLLISGVYILGFAFIPYTFLQGIGRPDLSAILHLVELPVFLAAAWFMTRHWGIRGAAVAWIARATLELICMHLLSLRFLPHCRGSILQTLALLSGTLLTLAGISFIPPLLLRVLVSALCLGVFYLVVWLFLFNEKERGEARHWLRRLPFPTGP
jgi:O-antigen/teichoic acid export membrane protein